jgi:SH3-like domain-containing protein
VTLLSDQRTAVVRPGQPRPIHLKASEASRVRYRAEPGVVGRIEQCQSGWCHIAIGKREGFIRTADIWGVDDGEVVD